MRVRDLLLCKVALRLGLVLAAVVLGALVAPRLLDSRAVGGGSAALLYLAFVCAYAAFWFGLAVLVNALGRTSSANGTMLVSAWLLLVVVVPATVVMITDAVHPTPSRVALMTEIREAAREAEGELSAFEGNHAGDTTGAVGAQRAVALQRGVEHRVEPVAATFHQQLGAQQALIDRLRFLSPAVVLFEALGDVSGNSVARYRAFLDQTAGYHRGFRDFFFERATQKRALGERDYAELAPFTFIEPSAAALHARAVGALLGLIAPTLLLLVAASRRLRRVTVFAQS